MPGRIKMGGNKIGSMMNGLTFAITGVQKQSEAALLAVQVDGVLLGALVV